MINRFPTWKNALVVLATVVGLVYAAPNLFGEDPAVQVSRVNVAVMDEASAVVVEDALRAAGRSYRELLVRDGLLYATFEDTEHQLAALDTLRDALGRGWVVALNRVPRTPGWLRAIGGGPMNLGLDLVGGVHFLLEVDLEAAVAQAEERHENGIRALLRNENIRYGLVGRQQDGSGIRATFRDAETRARAQRAVGSEFPELTARAVDDTEITLLVSLDESEKESVRRFAVEQNVTTLRNRVNELGVAEPLVQRQGEHRIVVQLPGVQDTARAKDILGATATLEWRLVYEDGDPFAAESSGRIPVGARLYHDQQGRPVLLKRDVIATGDQLTGAAAGIASDTGSPAVFINLDATAARKMGQTTRENLNRQMAVVMIENVTEMVERNGERVPVRTTVEEVISVATIQGVFSSRFQITGLEPQESRNLALLLRAGALAAPMDIVEERTVGPSMGADNIEQGFEAVLIGFAAVCLFVLAYYRVFGIVANLALFFNLVFIIAIMSMIPGATLTMPGIAGIVLTVGMAVDANVLIYERIREELRIGNSPQAAIHAGYEKAFSSIADANVTTLIASVVLFLFGTGPIKGFAVTLSIGIMTSMFTAIVGTRAVVNFFYGGRRVDALSI